MMRCCRLAPARALALLGSPKTSLLRSEARRSLATQLGERLPIRHACKLADGERVAVGGWVKSVRKHKSVTFVNVNDGSCLAELQLTLPAEDELAAGTRALDVNLGDITVGSSVFAEGVLREVPGKQKRVELYPETLKVLGTCDAQDYPLQKKYHSLEFLRENLHLRARTNTFGAVTRVRNALRYELAGYACVRLLLLAVNGQQWCADAYVYA